MSVLAFLQNMWVKNPDRIKAAIAEDGEEFRTYFMRYALFAGCKTGRMLKKAFGDKLIEQIIFEETTREIAGNPKEIFPAQPEHIVKALQTHKPRIVITFGAIAADALNGIWVGHWIKAPHPAARQPDTFSKLLAAANELKATIPIARPGLIIWRP